MNMKTMTSTSTNSVNIMRNNNHHRPQYPQHPQKPQSPQSPQSPRSSQRQEHWHFSPRWLAHRKRSHVSVCMSTLTSVSVRWLTFWVFVLCLLNLTLPEVIYRVDPLALLAATLRTYQRAGCDSEQLSLSCPRGTSISIELAQYGRAGDLSDHSLCPPVSHQDLVTANIDNANSGASDGVIHRSTEIEVKPPETCTVSGLQYLLLQTVVDACQKKRHCKFSANPKAVTNIDPCAGVRKFVEIAYKCRPYEFRSKVACENDKMPLVCNPYSRIAIYSASFGHIERENVQCGNNNTSDNKDNDGNVNSHSNSNSNNNNNNNNNNNSKQTCLVSYATETVMQICHGRRRCSITADANTFGRPCKHDVPMYLKVVYTCIPRKVLKDRYETAPESDEPQQSELDMDQDDLYDEDQFYKESEAIPPAPKLQGAIPKPPFDMNFGVYDHSTTMKPPTFIHGGNDSSLEERPSTSTRIVWLFQQSNSTPERNHNNLFASNVNLTTSSVTNDDKYVNSAEHKDAVLTSSTSAPLDDLNLSNSTWRTFFYRQRCQTEDDWGLIGLNCTDTDMTIERVEVSGFLINWVQTYIHIRKNQEQFYLYLIISVAAGVLLCLTLVVGRITLQRQNTCRKNSNSNCSNNGKNFGDATGGGCGGSAEGNNEKYHTSVAAGRTHLPTSFGDDISDIDADLDLTSAIPVPSLSSRNETYTAYTPVPSCTYSGGGPPLPPSASTQIPTSSATLVSATTTVLMPASHQTGLHMSVSNSVAKAMDGSAAGMSAGRQTSTLPVHYTNQNVCSPSVSGPLTMGPHVLTPTGLNTVPQYTPSYLAGAIMVPSHQHTHTGTLRRGILPVNMGVLGSQPTSTSTVPTHSITGISTGSGVYYDATIPRNLSRGMSADNTQYFYG